MRAPASLTVWSTVGVELFEPHAPSRLSTVTARTAAALWLGHMRERIERPAEKSN
jgi:hypothetical protein